jgi:hypothetical protein
MISEEENDKRLKDILRVMDEYFEENKPPTLYEELMTWYQTHNAIQSSHDIVSEIVKIVRDWMPKEDPKSPPYDGWTKCVRHMHKRLK